MHEREPARLDVFGDPLPPGALARCGTHRFWHPPDEASRGVLAVCFSPDSRRLLSVSGATVRVWDLEDGGERVALSGHRDTVRAALYVSSRRIVTAGNDGTLRWWDAESGTGLKLRRLARRVTSLALAPDGRTLLAGTDAPTGFAMLDVERGELIRQVCPEEPVAGTALVAASPDGTRVFTLEQGWWREFRDAGRVCAFDWETGASRWTARGSPSYQPWLQFSPDGQRVTCSLGGAGHPAPWTFDVRTGAPVRDASAPRERGAWGLPDGTRLRMRHEGVELLRGSSVARVLPLPTEHGAQDMTPVPSPDGRFVAFAGRYGAILAMALRTGMQGPGHAHRSGLQALTFSRDGARLLTYAWDGTLRIWDSASGEQVAWHDVQNQMHARLSHVSVLCLEHGRAWVGTGSPDVLLDLLTGAEVEVEGGFRPSRGTGSGDGALFAHIREEEGGARLAIVHDARTGRRLRRVPLPVKGDEARALSRSGRFLATWDDARQSSARSGQLLRVWDLERQALCFEQFLPDTDPWQLRFTPDDRGFAFIERPCTLVLVDLEQPERMRKLEAPEPISAFAFSEDGQTVALACRDGQVRVCGVDGRLLGVLHGHRDDVCAVAFSADGRMLASGSSDTTALIWKRSAWERRGR